MSDTKKTTSNRVTGRLILLILVGLLLWPITSLIAVVAAAMFLIHWAMMSGTDREKTCKDWKKKFKKHVID